MSETKIYISPKELQSIMDWIETFDPKPHRVEIIAHPTGIGTALRVEVETADGEGRYKDITDYENW